MFERPYGRQLLSRMNESRKFIQILHGPRQTGKTTLVEQILKKAKNASLSVSADDTGSAGKTWLEQQWNTARMQASQKRPFILAIDEIQKITGWSETVKKLWDEDTKKGIPLKVILLGSARMQIQKGVADSLMGRFEILNLPHWSFSEMRQAFDLNLENYIYFGGYPGSVKLIKNELRFRQYIRSTMIEPTLTRDILMMSRVDKPALLRNLFELGCSYSARIVSLTKILGRLMDAGNTTTLTHYLTLLDSAGLLTILEKFSPSRVKIRASLPKFQVHNTALESAMTDQGKKSIIRTPALWGHRVESAIGAHLINSCPALGINVHYWNNGENEVDFVLVRDGKIIALEIKSGSSNKNPLGMKKFKEHYPSARTYLIGQGGIGLEEFLTMDLSKLF